MKIFLVSLVVLVLIGIGFYFLKPNDATTIPIIQSKFFSINEITARDIVIKITKEGFSPKEISITRGERVVWVNEASEYAWPASNQHPAHTDYSEFDPKEPFENGEVWGFVFNKVGKWGYHDHMHPFKKGIITVLE